MPYVTPPEWLKPDDPLNAKSINQSLPLDDVLLPPSIDLLHRDLANIGVSIFVARVEGGKVEAGETVFNGTLEEMLQALYGDMDLSEADYDEEMPEEAAMDADLMAEIEGDPRTLEGVLSDLEAVYVDRLANGTNNVLLWDDLVYELKHSFGLDGAALLAYVNECCVNAQKKFNGE